jgi:spore coat protein U-like protein
MRSLALKIVAGLALASALPMSAEAGTAAGNLTVQMTITSSCTIAGATQNFGTVVGTSLLSVFADSSTAITVTCTAGSPYSIGIDLGANASGSQRRLANGGNTINYNLYLDALHLSPWTGATDSATCVTPGGCYLGTGNGSAQAINVYGQVAPLAIAPAFGTYTDNLVMTVNY